ncbi:MAG: nicotinate-nucleotide adenylyltransferase [Chloroflexota bacterium]|nr:nicotinate-nucleotide adenylyltransferase [Chloroflexota bacterium]
MTRLGLLGGTFDPPHYGHLTAAQEAFWHVRLDRVLFLPARQNPLKPSQQSSPAEARCEMVQRAIADDPRFELSRLDLERPPPSYTVGLLRALAATDRELFFIIGADIVAELPRWRAPLELLALAQLIVVQRHGAAEPDLAALERAVPEAARRMILLRVPGVAISSSELRQRVRQGQPIRYLTPRSVERYIHEHRLYQDQVELGAP